VQTGTQQDKTSGEADKIAVLSRYAATYLIIWIPACAGTTSNRLVKIAYA
jgi:hypothetical protein